MLEAVSVVWRSLAKSLPAGEAGADGPIGGTDIMKACRRPLLLVTRIAFRGEGKRRRLEPVEGAAGGKAEFLPLGLEIAEEPKRIVKAAEIVTEHPLEIGAGPLLLGQELGAVVTGRGAVEGLDRLKGTPHRSGLVAVIDHCSEAQFALVAILWLCGIAVKRR